MSENTVKMTIAEARELGESRLKYFRYGAASMREEILVLMKSTPVADLLQKITECWGDFGVDDGRLEGRLAVLHCAMKGAENNESKLTDGELKLATDFLAKPVLYIVSENAFDAT